MSEKIKLNTNSRILNKKVTYGTKSRTGQSHVRDILSFIACSKGLNYDNLKIIPSKSLSMEALSAIISIRKKYSFLMVYLSFLFSHVRDQVV